MSLWKKVVSFALCVMLVLGNGNFVFADGARVVTIGVNNTEEQKATIMKYFGVEKDQVEILEVNNQEERKYLEGVATEAQLGTKTYSCAYVEPKEKGHGINVKTANLTWLTSSRVASTLSTAGLTDADVVVASTFPVSGTGALTGIMKAFEGSTGEELDEEKKELASEELIVTGDLGEEIGAEQATGIVNDIKTEIIKNNTKDVNQIADVINNITNNYHVTLTPEQQKKLEDLMVKISEQDYDYHEMKNTLKEIGKSVNDKLDELGVKVDRGFFDSVKNWFSGLFDGNKDLGILESTDDSVLGEDAIIDATDDKAINLPSKEKVEGFFDKIVNWFKGLFAEEESETKTEEEQSVQEDTALEESGEAPKETEKEGSSVEQEESREKDEVDSQVEQMIENEEVHQETVE